MSSCSGNPATLVRQFSSRRRSVDDVECYRREAEQQLSRGVVAASNRLLDLIGNREWDVAMDRAVHCPGEASQWGVVTLRGVDVRLLPLHYACTLRPPPLFVRALLEAYPDTVMSPDKSGRLPIHWAVDASGCCPDVVDLLLEAYPNSAKCREDKYGFLPIHICCYRSEETSDPDEKVQIISRLLKANPEAAMCRDDMWWLPIHVAARTGASFAIIQRLLQAFPGGASYGDKNERLALHLACMNGRGDDDFLKMVGALIDNFPSGLSKREGKHSFLPLHIACSAPSASVHLIRMLVQKLPSALAEQDGCGSLPLHIAARANADPNVIEALVAAHPAGAMQSDKDGRLPLHWCCQMGAPVEVVDCLIEAYPGAIFVRENKYSYTSLHVACLRGAGDDVFKSLLSRSRAVASVADRHGMLPLHIACNEDSCVSIKTLKKTLTRLRDAYPQGVDARDHRGRTPIDLAMTCSDHDRKNAIVKVLEEAPSARCSDVDVIADRINTLRLDANAVHALKGLERMRSSGRHCSDGAARPGEERAVVSACVICLENRADYLLYPCGHVCLCEKCVKTKLTDLNNVCPVGRCPFQDAVKIFGVSN